MQGLFTFHLVPSTRHPHAKQVQTDLRVKILKGKPPEASLGSSTQFRYLVSLCNLELRRMLTIMPTPPLQYEQQYYMPQHHQMPPPQYPPQIPPQQLEQSLHSQMHSPQQQMQIDPALQLYYPGYNPYQQQQQSGHPSPHQQSQMSPMHPPPPPIHPQLSLPAHSPASSSSTQGSDYMGTPPADSISASSQHRQNGKRSSSSAASGGASGSRKKSRTDEIEDDGEGMSPSMEAPEGKVKATRGSR